MPVGRLLLEGCVDSYASALAAAAGGAGRLELCANLCIGGTTPSPELFLQVRQAVSIPVNVLIRPRFGDFLYSEMELREMCGSIARFVQLGADGIVAGALTADGALDADGMARLIGAAAGRPVTLHRAFDMARDPFAALEEAVRLGCRVILTSGQAASAPQGAALLARLRRQAAGRIEIMAGSGVKSGSIPALWRQTGLTSYHTSGRRGAAQSGMRYRKEGVSMGLPSLSEYEVWQASEEEFAACAAALRQLEAEQQAE